MAKKKKSVEPTIREFFRTIVKAPNGCWVRFGTLNWNGYGVCKHGGKQRRVHRWFYEKNFWAATL